MPAGLPAPHVPAHPAPEYEIESTRHAHTPRRHNGMFSKTGKTFYGEGNRDGKYGFWSPFCHFWYAKCRFWYNKFLRFLRKIVMYNYLYSIQVCVGIQMFMSLQTPIVYERLVCFLMQENRRISENRYAVTMPERVGPTAIYLFVIYIIL